MEERIKFPVVETINKRISVRTYNDTISLPPEMKVKLKEFIDSIKGPFGGQLRFEIIESDTALKGTNARLGTYGIIRGATSYGVAVGKKETKT